MQSEVQKIIARLDAETPRAYAAFLFYAGLPISERTKGSYLKAANHVGCHVKFVTAWVHEHHWLDRVGTLDAHDFLENHRLRSEMSREDNLRYIEKNREAKEKHLAIADKMLSVAQNLLETAELVEKVVEGDYVVTADGRRVPTKTIVHMKAKISDIPRLTETAVKISRLAAELPTEIIDHQPILTADLTKLSDEELSAMRDKNHRDILQLGAVSHIENSEVADLEPIG